MSESKNYVGYIANAVSIAVGSPYSSVIKYYFYDTAAESGQANAQIPYPQVTNTSTPISTNPTYAQNFKSLVGAERSIVTSAMSQVSQFADVTFQQAPRASVTDIGFAGLTYTSPSNEAAWADQGKRSSGPGNAWFATPSQIGSSSAMFGGGRQGTDFPYFALIHETGHLLGLQHTFVITPFTPLPGWSGNENTARFSVMSYNATSDTHRPTFEYQLYDIAALQRLYGRDDNFASGDNIYGFLQFFEINPGGMTDTTTSSTTESRYFSIWDSGGHDIIDASGPLFAVPLIRAAYIDLRPGHFSSLGPATGVVVSGGGVQDRGFGNVSIAFGAIIEDATGTDFNDAIVGNVYANTLLGGKGDDVIYGSASAIRDVQGREIELGISAVSGTLDVDDGDYRKIIKGGVVGGNEPNEATVSDELHGGDGDDLLVSGDGASFVFGDAGNDKLVGGDGSDTLNGGDGDDRLWGDAGPDVLDGGAGVDTALYASSGRPIAITYTGLSGSAGLKIVDGDGGIDTLSYMEKVIATSSRDTLKLVGNIANGTNLTIDANGGQSPNPRDTINTAEAGAGGVNIFIDPTSGAGYVMSNATTGKIGLVGFHTGIIGSEYDDTIIDLSTGRKEIMAGSGDDVVQVGVGSAFIDGGDGSDELRGGDGNDVLAGGEGTNILVGGAGSDLIKTSSSFQGYEMYYSDVGDVIDGGEGHDWISLEGYARSARGGPGNDVIDPTSGSAQVVYFRTGDGHDTVLASGSYSVSVAIEDVSMHDVTFIFEIKETGWITENDDSTLPLIYWMAGDLAVKINATGETIVIPNQGISLYHEWDLDGEHFTGAPNYYSVSWDSYVLSFSDGTIYDWVTENNMGFFDYGTPKIQFGSVASYKVAVENFNSAIAQDSHVEGGAGDDHLSGTGGSDAYSGGDGDDSIEASAGSDTIDGGAGDDELVLLGAEADYRFTRNADGSTLVASVGGGVSDTTFVNVEKVSFLADGTSVAIADLFTGLGTTGDDTLNGTHGDDQIVGLAGDDLISGGRGNDVIDGGDGVDTVTFTGVAGDYSAYRADNGSIGIESLSGTADYDTLINAEWIVFQGDGTRIAVTDFPEYGTSGSDTITGTVMAEDLYGDDGDDVLIGLGGSDDLDGGAGADTMSGGPGDDTYLVDDPGDSLIESAGEGFDRVYSIDTDFTLSAHVENLSLAYGGLNGVGNASDNEITGNYYGNYLQGLGGADVLISGGGSDTLDGGDGFDIAVFDFNSTNFTIVKSVDDSITISGFYGFWTSTLTNIELIRFSGDGVDIDTSLLDVTQMESPPPYNYYSVDHAYRSDRCPIMSPDILIV